MQARVVHSLSPYFSRGEGGVRGLRGSADCVHNLLGGSHITP
jgi:hypothetical protein